MQRRLRFGTWHYINIWLQGQLSNLLVTVALALIIVGLFGTGKGEAAPLEAVPDTYPGVLEGEGARGLFYIEPQLLTIGVQTYQSLHGSWPERWSDVVAAGIITAPLLTPFGLPVDPDDRVFKHDYDFHYDYHDGEPRYAVFIEGAAQQVTYYAINEFPPLIPASAETQPELLAMLEVEGRKLQLAHYRAVIRCLYLFGMLKGRAPASWGEFAASGFCPLAPGTDNPLTGEDYSFGAGSNELCFTAMPNAGDYGGYRFKPLDQNAQEFWPYDL